jgi:hypothetical protein
LFIVPLVFALAGMPPGAANATHMEPVKFPQHSLTVAEVGGEITGTVAGVPVPATGTIASASTASAALETQAGDGREDLTVFFSIGVIVDVLLVTAFLIWAVRQWRKTGKQEPNNNV